MANSAPRRPNSVFQWADALGRPQRRAPDLPVVLQRRWREVQEMFKALGISSTDGILATVEQASAPPRTAAEFARRGIRLPGDDRPELLVQSRLDAAVAAFLDLKSLINQYARSPRDFLSPKTLAGREMVAEKNRDRSKYSTADRQRWCAAHRLHAQDGLSARESAKRIAQDEGLPPSAVESIRRAIA